MRINLFIKNRVINPLVKDYLGIDLGFLITEWVVAGIASILIWGPLIIIFGFLSLVHRGIAIGLTIFSLYLLSCFIGSTTAISRITSRFRWLEDLAGKWEYLSPDEVNEIENAISKIINKHQSSLNEKTL